MKKQTVYPRRRKGSRRLLVRLAALLLVFALLYAGVPRLWRQGQTASTVVIHHIMTKGTIDVQIMQALERKDKTQSALIDAVKAQLGGIR